jgi:hypothetical protein
MVLRELTARLGLDVDGAGFQAADAALSLVKGGLVAIGSLAVAAATGIAAAAVKTAEYADATQKAAQRTGIAVDELQALQYAAERADVGAGELQAALNHMARRGVKDFEAELRRAADELMRVPEGGARAKRAIELLGRSGVMLLPMLHGGSAAIDEMTQKARDMGLVLGGETQQAGVELKDTLEDLQGYLRGITYMIGGPALKPLREMLAKVVGWLRENRVAVRNFVTGGVNFLVKALESVWRMMEPVRDLLGWLASGTRELLSAARGAGPAVRALGIALAVAFGGPLAMVLALLAVMEEVWGWVTGKRRTLLEDWLGPYAEFAKNNPFGQAIEGWNLLLTQTRELLGEIRALLPGGGMGPNEARGYRDATAFSKGLEVAGATSAADQIRLAKDERFTAFARAGDWEAIRATYAPSVPTVGASTSPTTFTGDFHFHSPATDPVAAGKEFYRMFNFEMANASAAAK